MTEVNPTRPHKDFFINLKNFFMIPITPIKNYPNMKIIVENDNYISHRKTLKFIQNEFLKFSSTKKFEQATIFLLIFLTPKIIFLTMKLMI